MGLPRITLISILLSQTLSGQLTTNNGGSVILLEQGDYQNWIDQGTPLVTENPDEVIILLPEPVLGPIQIDHPVDPIDIPIDIDTGLGTGTSELTNYKLDEIISAIRAGDQADDTEELEKIISLIEEPVIPNDFDIPENFRIQSFETNQSTAEQTVYLPFLSNYIDSTSDELKTIFKVESFDSLADSIPEAKSESLIFHIADVGEHTFEIDLGHEKISVLLQIAKIGLSLVIVWGLLWTFFKLNSVLLAT